MKKKDINTFNEDFFKKLSSHQRIRVTSRFGAAKATVRHTGRFHTAGKGGILLVDAFEEFTSAGSEKYSFALEAPRPVTIRYGNIIRCEKENWEVIL